MFWVYETKAGGTLSDAEVFLKEDERPQGTPNYGNRDLCGRGLNGNKGH